MTPQETARMRAEVLVAFAEGKTIQAIYKSSALSEWRDQPNPLWDWIHFEYRIKPAEPKKVKLSAFVTEKGQLIHYDMLKFKIGNSGWTRVPSLDLEYEVAE